MERREYNHHGTTIFDKAVAYGMDLTAVCCSPNNVIIYIMKLRRTRIQLQNELVEIESRICKGKTDSEIMDELHLKERTYYYYKSKLYEQSAELQRKKTEETLAFETQLLKDRLTRLYRHVEQRLTSENTKCREAADLSEVAGNIAINIFKLENEGRRALHSSNNLSDMGLDLTYS